VVIAPVGEASSSSCTGESAVGDYAAETKHKPSRASGNAWEEVPRAWQGQTKGWLGEIWRWLALLGGDGASAFSASKEGQAGTPEALPIRAAGQQRVSSTVHDHGKGRNRVRRAGGQCSSVLISLPGLCSAVNFAADGRRGECSLSCSGAHAAFSVLRGS
jgi:hypothetical protein